MNYAYVTTVNSDKYIVGALLLNKRIKKLCEYPFYLITDSKTNTKYEGLFKRESINTIVCDDIVLDESIVKRMEGTPVSHWIKTFFKLNIFSLTQFDKLVYIDSDILLLNSYDELFNNNKMSAVSDGDFCLNNNEGLNSGVMMIVPNKNTYNTLINSIYDCSKNKTLFGDQDVVSMVFKDYLKLDRAYNSGFANLDRYDIKKFNGIHFYGKKKPWDWNFIYAFIRIYSYLIRGRFYTFKYSQRYFLLVKREKRKVAKFARKNAL